MLIELSYPICPDMPKWPTNPAERFVYELSTDRGCACNASSVFHHMHTGTHVDAPRHFDPAGKTIDQIPTEDFWYTAPLVLRLPKTKGQRVEREELKRAEEQIRACDILLLDLGYSELRETDPAAFADDFPSISPAAAQYLREEFPALKAVALDSLSVDSPVTADKTGYPAHHCLLETSAAHPQRTLLIYEDVNVKKLRNVGRLSAICAFPLRFAGLEASPVSMVAFTE